jgi:hypothetical protein
MVYFVFGILQAAPQLRSSALCIDISEVRFIQFTKTAVLNKLNAGVFIFMHYSVLLRLLFLR